MTTRLALLILSLALCCASHAADPDSLAVTPAAADSMNIATTAAADSITATATEASDTTAVATTVLAAGIATAEKADSTATAGEQKPKRNFFKSVAKVARSVIAYLFHVNTDYIEPSHYKFQTLMQNNVSYEAYRVSGNNGSSVSFSPKPSMKIGPSASWSILSYGYSIDVLHLKNKDNRQETALSLYTIPFGVDLFYRKSGNEYRINHIKFANGKDASRLENREFDGIKASVKGLNLYYIINHKKFSYPAAYNRSTQQKKSCGSILAGVGYTQHSLEIDWGKLNGITKEEIGDSITTNKTTESITYTDLSVSCGYAYNWVFAKNWLLAGSLSLALSYKRSMSKVSHGIKGTIDDFVDSFNFTGFKFSDITFDGVGRFGIVWFNLRWFAGANVILHSYNYSKPEFYTNNIFGSLCIYAGVNFGVKKKYKKTKPAPNYATARTTNDYIR